MNTKTLRILLLTACAVLIASLIILGVVIGVRMANGGAEAEEPGTRLPPREGTEPAESETQTEPVPIRATVRIAAALRSDKQEQQALADALGAFADAFTASHPGVAIEYVWSKAIPDKPDGVADLLLGTASDIEEYGKTGKTEDLTELVNGCGIDVLPSALRMGQAAGSQILVPFCYDRAVLYADRAVWDAFGVTLPEAGYTYEDFENLTVRLTGEVGGTQYVGVHMPYYMPYVYLTYVRGLSGEPVVGGKLVLSTGGNYEALKSMFTLLDYGYAQSWKYDAYGSDKAYCAMSWTSACRPGANGRYTDGPYEKSLNPGKNADALLAAGRLVMLPLPRFNGASAGTGISDTTYGFMKTASTALGAEADAVIVFALSPEGQTLLNRAYGGIPVNRAVLGESFWRTGHLGCPGSDSVLYGIDSDKPDRFCDMLTTGKLSFYESSVRLQTISWAYLYNGIGETNHSVDEYYKPYLAEFETWANKMTK